MVTTLQSEPRLVSGQPAAVAEPVQRWTLNRAGIINVYQYADETLHFGGGRLLLRGVNGSGKSTAMNMLLPFLLDADARRIDAAGEQSGVLRSWMLSGRDEAQPQGYLWLEVAKGDATLSFGCGIRANRAADQVTTWWFVTSRRPGLDLHLVEGRVPVSRDALKAIIEPDPVFRQEERDRYRDELRKRLFGGADIEQHLHLLRVVRNPRVGDRLDAELPQYLQDALPQLSDAALDDAAQPLEDLEEHRRNVADLGRTAEALDAVHATYRNYARTELHRLADHSLAAVRIYRDRRRGEDEARVAHDEAIERQRDATARKHQLDADVESQRGAIAALEASDAYKSGAQLNDLRELVTSLARGKAAAEEALRSRQSATERAACAVRSARQEAAADHDTLRRGLADLASLASGCRLPARPTGAPPIAPDPSSPAGLELAPPEPIGTGAAEHALAALRDAARQRIDEVQTVGAAVEAVEPAERALRDAGRTVADTQSLRDVAVSALADARKAFQSLIEAWQGATADWVERLRRHHASHALGAVETPAEIGGIVEEIVRGRSVGTMLEALTAPAIRHLESRRAQLEAALQRQREIVTELENRAAELAAKQLPDPPMLGWQQRAGRCFAELVDFAEHLDAPARAGLEAALEASGLLAAEVHGDGALRLADGQLVIAPDAQEVPSPLLALLRTELPHDAAACGARAAVERVLGAISTDPAADADTLVTVEGEFRIGAVRGKHVKPEAEHIGVTARRATLARLRAETARELAGAKAQHDRVAADLESASAALQEAVVLRSEVPPDRDLHTALWRRNEAETSIEKAEEQLRVRRAEFSAAEQRHADAVTHAHETAARMSLPTSLAELRSIGNDLERVMQDSREAQRGLAQAVRAVARWRERSEDWRAARTDEHAATTRLASVSAEWKSAQERFATLEPTLGVAYADVVASIARKTDELAAARLELEAIDAEREQAVRAVASAEKGRQSTAVERERAHVVCVQTLGMLQRALAVPGLVDAAMDASIGATPEGSVAGEQTTASDPGASDVGAGREFADVERTRIHAVSHAVEDSPAGARRLAGAIRARVPRPDGPPTSAEGVRQSMRRRRDSLGAGWDAEDRQPDEQLPLHIEVTGPLAQQTPLPSALQVVHRQLATMTSLLSTKQHQALRNLLQGLVAREVADKLHAAGELIEHMNERLSAITTSHGIGVSLRWRRRDDLDPELAESTGFLAKPPDLRTADEDQRLSATLGRRIADAHREDPGTPYRELIARVLDYRDWYRMTIMLHRPGQAPARLGRRTALSEGEKKVVSYLPLFAAVAASCDVLAAGAPDALRFVLLDDAFAKVSEDNHAKLFGLLVELDLDFIATSERLWGTHDTVPQLAITEVIRDADLETIVLEHSRWSACCGVLAR